MLEKTTLVSAGNVLKVYHRPFAEVQKFFLEYSSGTMKYVTNCFESPHDDVSNYSSSA